MNAKKKSYRTDCIRFYLRSCMSLSIVERVNIELCWTSQPHRTHTQTVNSCGSGDVIFLRPMSSDTFDTSNNLPCVCVQKKKTQWPSPTWISERTNLYWAESSPIPRQNVPIFPNSSEFPQQCKDNHVQSTWNQPHVRFVITGTKARTFLDFRHFPSMRKCFHINRVQLWYPATWQFTKTPAVFTKHLRREFIDGPQHLQGCWENHNTSSVSITIKDLTV